MGLESGLTLSVVLDIIKHFDFDQETVLIGGQALAWWTDYYHPIIPNNLKAYISLDLDFLAGQTVAVLASDRLSGTVYLPNMDDATPQSGKVFLKKWQTIENIEIDFLHSVAGLDSMEIEKKAVMIDIGGHFNIKVMHPVHCFESRLYNLKLLAFKRTEKGISQAKLAISVINKYLIEQLQNNNERIFFNIVERIHYLSVKDVGLQVFFDYGINVLDAVPIDSVKHKEFLQKRWEQLCQQTEQKRNIYQKMRDRIKNIPSNVNIS